MTVDRCLSIFIITHADVVNNYTHTGKEQPVYERVYLKTLFEHVLM